MSPEKAWIIRSLCHQVSVWCKNSRTNVNIKPQNTSVHCVLFLVFVSRCYDRKPQTIFEHFKQEWTTFAVSWQTESFLMFWPVPVFSNWVSVIAIFRRQMWHRLRKECWLQRLSGSLPSAGSACLSGSLHKRWHPDGFTHEMSSHPSFCCGLAKEVVASRCSSWRAYAPKNFTVALNKTKRK